MWQQVREPESMTRMRRKCFRTGPTKQRPESEQGRSDASLLTYSFGPFPLFCSLLLPNRRIYWALEKSMHVWEKRSKLQWLR